MGIKRVIQYRRFKASLGSPIYHPTPVYEVNDGMISKVKQDILTPRIKYLDIPMTWYTNKVLKKHMLQYSHRRVNTKQI